MEICGLEWYWFLLIYFFIGVFQTKLFFYLANYWGESLVPEGGNVGCTIFVLIFTWPLAILIFMCGVLVAWIKGR